MHAFLQTYDEQHDLVKFLDTWVATLKDEVLPKSSFEDFTAAVPINPTYVAMFYRLSSCILDLINKKIEVIGEERQDVTEK